MSVSDIVNSARVGMMRGKRFSPKEIGKYEVALKQHVDNTRVEAMFLYFAEVLHDEYGFGMKRIRNVINKVDESMHEWLKEDFNMDDLRVRVFGKTSYIFACDEDDWDHIYKVLEAAGYTLK